jgi:hypothetical protein
VVEELMLSLSESPVSADQEDQEDQKRDGRRCSGGGSLS